MAIALRRPAQALRTLASFEGHPPPAFFCRTFRGLMIWFLPGQFVAGFACCQFISLPVELSAMTHVSVTGTDTEPWWLSWWIVWMGTDRFV